MCSIAASYIFSTTKQHAVVSIIQGHAQSPVRAVIPRVFCFWTSGRLLVSQRNCIVVLSVPRSLDILRRNDIFSYISVMPQRETAVVEESARMFLLHMSEILSVDLPDVALWFPNIKAGFIIIRHREASQRTSLLAAHKADKAFDSIVIVPLHQSAQHASGHCQS